MTDIEKWMPPLDKGGHFAGKIDSLESALLQLQDSELRGRLDEKIKTEKNPEILKNLQMDIWRFILDFDSDTYLAPGIEDRPFEGRAKDVALLLTLFTFAGAILPVGAKDPLARSESNVENRKTRDQLRKELDRVHEKVTQRLQELGALTPGGSYNEFPPPPAPRTWRGR